MSRFIQAWLLPSLILTLLTIPFTSAAQAVADAGRRIEIVFFDSMIQDRHILAADIDARAEIVLLDASGDALAQIAGNLERRSGIDAIHIFSHGRPGALIFASGAIDAGLGQYATQLQIIGDALKSDGDILLYGCQVGALPAGEAFLASLAQATGADIAASDNLTGAGDKGGDWVLENFSGEVAPSLIAEKLRGSGYREILTPASENFDGGVDQNIDNAQLNVGHWSFDWLKDDVVLTSGSFGSFFVAASGFTDLTDGGADKILDALGTLNAADGVLITSTNGSFRLDSLAIALGGANSETGLSIEGLNGTAVVATHNITVVDNSPGDNPGQTVTFTGAQWEGLSAFRIVTTSGIDDFSMYLDDITVSGLNTEPAVTTSGTEAAFVEDGGAVSLDTAVVVSDSDGDTISGATVQITGNYSTGADVLAVSVQPGITSGFSAVSGTLTLSGTASAADYQSVLRTLTFNNTSDTPSTAPRTITYAVTDSRGGSSAASTVSLTVATHNDDPMIAVLPVSVSFAEDTPGNCDLSAATFSDVDSGAGTVSLTLAAGAGTFAASSGVVTVGGSGSGTLTLSGTAADIDTYLNTASNIQYAPAAGQSGSPQTTITLTANDGGNTGSGGGDNVALGSVNVNVAAVNDAPQLHNLSGSPVFIEDGPAVVLSGTVTVSDVELDALNGGNGNYAGAGMTIVRVGGADSYDRLSVATGGSLSVVGGPSGGGRISAGGNVIASITDSGNGRIQITFANNGTIPATALVNEVLQAITYGNVNDDPPATVVLDWTFSDGNTGGAGSGGALSATGLLTVSLSGVNDAPTIAATGNNQYYTEGHSMSDLFSTVTCSTVEAIQRFTSLTLTLSNVSDGASEILRVDGSDIALTNGNSLTSATNGISVGVTTSGPTVTVNVTGASMTYAQLQTLIDSLGYRNTSDNPTVVNNRVVTITQVADNGGTAGGGQDTASLNLQSTVSLIAVNDPPQITNVFDEDSQIIAGSGSQRVSGFADAVVSNTDSFDYNGGSLVIAQSSGTANGNWGLDGMAATSGGDLTIAAGETIQIGGVSVGTVHATNDGQGGNSLQIDFNSANADSVRILTLVRNLFYDAPTGLGQRTFHMNLNDGDGTANGGDSDASGNFTITVTPNPPVVSNLNGDSGLTVQNIPLPMDAGANVDVSDADSANFNGGRLLIARGGSLAGNFSLNLASASSGGDAVFAAGEDVAVGGVVIGSVMEDGQSLNNLTITFNIEAMLSRVQTLLRSLLYTSGEIGAHSFDLTLSDAAPASSPATSAVSRCSVNVQAALENTVPGGFSGVDGTSLAIGGLSVKYSGSLQLTVTLSIPSSAGILTVTGPASISGSGSNGLLISGAIADINATLATLLYIPAVDIGGAQVITVVSTDGIYSDTDTITVAISDRPTILNLDGDSQQMGAGQSIPLDLGANAEVTDVDSSVFTGGNLIIQRVNPALSGSFALDGISALSGGDAAIAAGEIITVAGTAIGTVVEAGQDSANLKIDLNAAATPLMTGQLLQHLRYSSTMDGTHHFDATVTDALDGTVSAAARATIVLDGTLPRLTSFTRYAPTARETNADVLQFAIAFSEAVENVDAGDFASGGCSAEVSAFTPLDTARYVLTLTAGNLAECNGSVELNLAIGQDISDSSGNALVQAEPPVDEDYNVDNAPPEVSITPLTTSDRTPAISGAVNEASAMLALTVANQQAVPRNIGDGTWHLEDNILAALAYAAHDVTVTAWDAAGNSATATNIGRLLITPGVDDDNIPAEIENGAPNYGDGNNDGIPDSEQSWVASLPTAGGATGMTLVVSGGCDTFGQVNAVHPSMLPPDGTLRYLHGLVAFQLPCDAAELTIIFHNATSFTHKYYRQYGPRIPGDAATTGWYGLGSFAGSSGNSWVLDLQDNRLGDDTGADHLIKGMGGPGMPPQALPPFLMLLGQ